MAESSSQLAPPDVVPFPSVEVIIARLETALRQAAVKPLVVDAAGLGRLLSCSKRHIARMKAAGELPPAVTLGGGAKVGWLMADVELFLSVRCDMSAFDAAKRRR